MQMVCFFFVAYWTITKTLDWLKSPTTNSGIYFYFSKLVTYNFQGVAFWSIVNQNSQFDTTQQLDSIVNVIWIQQICNYCITNKIFAICIKILVFEGSSLVIDFKIVVESYQFFSTTIQISI